MKKTETAFFFIFVFRTHPICVLYKSVQNSSQRRFWPSIFPRRSPKTQSFLGTINFAQQRITHFISEDFKKKIAKAFFRQSLNFHLDAESISGAQRPGRVRSRFAVFIVPTMSSFLRSASIEVSSAAACKLPTSHFLVTTSTFSSPVR